MTLECRASALDDAALPAKGLKETTASKTVRTSKKKTSTATSGEKIPDFYRPEFMTTEKIHPADFPATDLSNDIHAVFACKLFWPAVDYLAVKMPARLASKMLETGAVQALLYTIVAHRDPLRRLSTEDAYGPHMGYSERDCSPQSSRIREEISGNESRRHCWLLRL